ncbi:hypothetical protein WN943_013691 [Citrus x changshan-huyou]
MRFTRTTLIIYKGLSYSQQLTFQRTFDDARRKVPPHIIDYPYGFSLSYFGRRIKFEIGQKDHRTADNQGTLIIALFCRFLLLVLLCSV